MKNNVKRFVALMTAATMIAAPCAVSASSTSNSSGILEFDNSTAPTVGNVVLPTLTDDTFDFTIDPEDRLNEYRPEIYTNTGAGIYFETVATKGAIQLKTNTGAALKIYGKTGSAISNLQSAATISTSGAVTALSTSSAFYVWAPKTVGSEEGDYVRLTKDNIKNYFVISGSSITDFKERIGDAATDQTVYTDDEITSPTDNPEDYVIIDKTGAITGFQPGIKISTGAAVDAKEANELQIGKSEKEWTNHSDKLRIINKSANDITVKANVTVDVASGSGLTYLDYSDVASSTAAAISFQIKDVTNNTEAAITTSGSSISGEYTSDLAAATGASIHYITGEVNDKTGGDVFKQYTGPAPTYEEIELQIEATVSTSAGAKEAWKEYADNLTAETRPEIKVVYSFENADSDAETDLGAAPDLPGFGQNGTDCYWDMSSQNLSTIDKIMYSVDGSSYQELATSAYSFNAGWVSFKKEALKNLNNGSFPQYYKIVSNGTTYKVSLW